MQKIGKGKYSYVFKCINVENNQPAVVKVLKPSMMLLICLVKIEKIKREVKILKELNGREYIVKLYGAAFDQCSQTYSLIYPYVHCKDIRDLPDEKLTLGRITRYIKKIMQVHNYLMHRHSNTHILKAYFIETSRTRMSCMTHKHSKHWWQTGDWPNITTLINSTM